MELKFLAGLRVTVENGARPQSKNSKGYRLANVELSVPATEESIYEIASVGKTFTATATMMLVEQKLLPSVVADTIGDKGYDADERVIEPLQVQGKTAVLPPRRNRKSLQAYDKELYKCPSTELKTYAAKLKQYRAITTRYDKRA